MNSSSAINLNLELEDLRKAQILQAALIKISEMGSANVTLDDIAKQAGMSKGGVAYYYKSKDILCKEAFKEFFVRIFRRSKETLSACSDPLGKLLSFGWLYNWDDPEVNLGYPMLMDAMAMAARDAEYRKMFHEWVQVWVSILGEALSEGISKGIFPEMDTDNTARTISSIYHGIAVRWYLDPESHTSEWAVAAFTHSITSLLKKG
ncbi:MAG: hypothetical protein CVV44_22830 [Spirochaetae bacterium HGW-Spirochaetae-1]|jgi:TetR/AcrR family transcriptional repressor of bet genes|nr:MAG: hypothetical protein CVV44_22830 [Spirochaetae bacterium HGW-Spirochaetae-1]